METLLDLSNSEVEAVDPEMDSEMVAMFGLSPIETEISSVRDSNVDFHIHNENPEMATIIISSDSEIEDDQPIQG